MIARPILMNAAMVRATLREMNPKTQTRRIVKPQPVDPARSFRYCGGGSCSWDIITKGRPYGVGSMTGEQLHGTVHCPYGQPGDRLWVREACRAEERESDMVDGVRYLADDAFREIDDTREAADQWIDLNHYRTGSGEKRGQTVPPIHMPRWASRITLEITDVRVERLQEIDSEDVLAEGCAPCLDCDEYLDFHRAGELHGHPADYRSLWESINGAGSWAANPWVWALTFKRVAQVAA